MEVDVGNSLKTADASIAVRQSLTSYKEHREKLNKLSNMVNRPRSNQDPKIFYVNRYKTNPKVNTEIQLRSSLKGKHF